MKIKRNINGDGDGRREKVLLVKEEPYPYCRSSRLHNFHDLPSAWGTQRILRDAKFHAMNAPAADHRFDSTIEFDLKHIRSILKKKKKNKYERIGFGIEAFKPQNRNNVREEVEEEDVEVVEAVDKPWNLRKRRAACNASNPITIEKTAVRVSPLRAKRASRLRSSGHNGGEKKAKTRVKFSVNLSKAEIEEDYLMMIGEKPPGRHKKRSKTTLQRQYDAVTPGLWLSEVTLENGDV